jgi:hypothetical protein
MEIPVLVYRDTCQSCKRSRGITYCIITGPLLVWHELRGHLRLLRARNVYSERGMYGQRETPGRLPTNRHIKDLIHTKMRRIQRLCRYVTA